MLFNNHEHSTVKIKCKFISRKLFDFELFIILYFVLGSRFREIK